MAFRPEEILEEFAEAASLGQEWVQDFRYTTLSRGVSGTAKSNSTRGRERYARTKADPAKLARRRQIARESQRRCYAKKKAAGELRWWGERYAQVKADPVQWEKLLKRQREYKRRKRGSK